PISWQSKPEDFERRRRAHGLQSRQVTNARKPTIGRDHQLRSHFVPAVPTPVPHAADLPIVTLQQGLDPTAHDQTERGAALGLLDNDTQETDLWHVRHERVRRLEPADRRKGGPLQRRGGAAAGYRARATSSTRSARPIWPM